MKDRILNFRKWTGGQDKRCLFYNVTSQPTDAFKNVELVFFSPYVNIILSKISKSNKNVLQDGMHRLLKNIIVNSETKWIIACILRDNILKNQKHAQDYDGVIKIQV